MKSIAIVGGGIVGLAIGNQLSLLSEKFKVSLFEKETNIGQHQSGNNSGVLHCGLYYKPGSLKAKLAIDGIKAMTKFCLDNKINHEICGKIVVATNKQEEVYLDNLAERGKLNGLDGLRFLNKEELKIREPFVLSSKTLLVPQEGIVDYKSVMEQFLKNILNSDGEVHMGIEVSSVKQEKNKYIIQVDNIEKKFDIVINCAGLFSDRLYRKITNQVSPVRIIPFRGEYMHISKNYHQIINHLVYPVPDPQYPFLGVHFTRMINGAREVGPNAVLALKREGYKNTDFSFRDSFETFTYKGFQNFLRKNFRFAINEFISSLSKDAFVNKAKKLIPEVEEYMFERGGTAGVRAQAISNSGELIMDFNIIKDGNQIHVLNAPSPGATASIAIADYIIKNYII